MKVAFVKLLLVVFFCCYAYGSASPVYDKAVSFYKAGQYDSTITLIRGFLKVNGKDPETEVLVPLLNEALVRKGDYSSVQKLFSMFRQKYASSSFMPRMWYIKGVADAKQKHEIDAITDFSTALEGGVSGTLEEQVVSNVEQLCKEKSLDELTSLLNGKLELKVQEIVRYFEIVKLNASGQFAKAQSRADDFRGLFPRSKYEPLIRDLVNKARDQEKNSLRIGLLAPLSGDASEVGKKVVNGAKLAFEMYNAQASQIVMPVILDTKGSMMENAHCTKELLEEHKVQVILGPVLSQDAIVSAAMVMGKNSVMLTPTATEDGIAQLGNNVFQMNVSTGVLARKIAAYAMENLNMKEFAILAPQTDYGSTLATSFKEELKKKNIKVVAEEYFEEGANDFSATFQALRSKLLLRYLEKLALDKGIGFKGRVSRGDSIKYADTVLTVGGLFIPAEAEDVVMIAPQVAFNRIHTQILGSNGWQSKKVLQDGGTYVQGAMISATIEPDQSVKEWVDFKKSFKARFNEEPDRIAALGYDAANLIINALREAGNDNSSRIADALSKIHAYQGLSGVVSFDQLNGSNTEAVIMKISTNGFVRVQ